MVLEGELRKRSRHAHGAVCFFPPSRIHFLPFSVRFGSTAAFHITHTTSIDTHVSLLPSAASETRCFLEELAYVHVSCEDTTRPEHR